MKGNRCRDRGWTFKKVEKEIEHFFVSYNDVRGKKFKPIRRKGSPCGKTAGQKADEKAQIATASIEPRFYAIDYEGSLATNPQLLLERGSNDAFAKARAKARIDTIYRQTCL